MTHNQSNEGLSAKRAQVIMPGLTSGTACHIASAKGAMVTDVEGNELIDFAGGIAVMNVGHSHPRVVAAIKDQAEKFTHTCLLVMPYAAAIELADRLCAAAPGDFAKMAMFVSTGAEAVENAVKIARYSSKKPGVIAFDNAFHGRTLLAMTLTSKVKPYKFGFGPYAPEVYHMPYAYCYRCPFNLRYPSCDVACADYLNEFFITHTAPENTAALIVEPIQGEGGFMTPPPEYFPKLKKICEANEILFIADEIQTGIGRTGKMFAIEHWGVEPDLMTVAKSLAAGMPLAGVVGRKEVMAPVHAFGVGGTYGGNPVCCRAALAVMDIFEEENLLATGEALGDELKQRFEAWQQEYEIIGDVRGKGAMLALELVKDRDKKTPAPDETKALVQFCLKRGLAILACGTYGNVIRVLMPLVIEKAQLEKGLAIMEEGFASISA